MRLNRAYLMFAALVAVAFVGCKNDDPNDNSFDNRLYIEAEAKVSTLMVKPNTITESKIIRAGVAKPAEQQIDIVYKADPNMVDLYNKAYYDEAIMLPEENYELVESTATISAGSVTSTDVNISFKTLNTLDRKLTYVLPVTIESATNIDMLASARTAYYVFKAGAFINVVANVKNNYLAVKWVKATAVSSISKITMEALVRVHSFDHIMSIMGIEGKFLMRISDEGYGSKSVQIATSDSSFPPADKAPDLEKDKWTMISMTMDVRSGDYVIYFNGEKVAEGVGPELRPLNLAVDGVMSPKIAGFWIGLSYENTRWLDGEISECRIWNVIRTQAQIAASIYDVDPASTGLVAYWKFDEGAGLMVNDRTINGNHATASSPLKWVKVTLPE